MKNDRVTYYKNISDSPRMGMNNELCIYLVAYCKSKRVYLSEKDMTFKKCMEKPTFDMLGVQKCKWLEMVDMI